MTWIGVESSVKIRIKYNGKKYKNLRTSENCGLGQDNQTSKRSKRENYNKILQRKRDKRACERMSKIACWIELD